MILMVLVGLLGVPCVCDGCDGCAGWMMDGWKVELGGGWEKCKKLGGVGRSGV
jgi:hypothetical protein